MNQIATLPDRCGIHRYVDPQNCLGPKERCILKAGHAGPHEYFSSAQATVTSSQLPARRPFSLPAAIADFIRERDSLWAGVKIHLDAGIVPSPRDIGLLAVANEACLNLLTLTPGPSTPVLDPLRAYVEILLCRACALFIRRLKQEAVAALKGHSPAQCQRSLSPSSDGEKQPTTKHLES